MSSRVNKEYANLLLSREREDALVSLTTCFRRALCATAHRPALPARSLFTRPRCPLVLPSKVPGTRFQRERLPLLSHLAEGLCVVPEKRDEVRMLWSKSLLHRRQCLLMEFHSLGVIALRFVHGGEIVHRTSGVGVFARSYLLIDG